MGVYVRSRFRADAITWVTTSHRCIFIEDADGMLRVYDQSPWSTSAQLRWTTGVPNYDIFAHTQRDTLLGPPIAWTNIHDPNMKSYNWKRLGFEYGSGWLNPPAGIDLVSRDPFGDYEYSGPGGWSKMNVRGLWGPAWVPPSVFAIPPGLWLTTAGRSRYRSHSRRRRGQCIRWVTTFGTRRCVARNAGPLSQ